MSTENPIRSVTDKFCKGFKNYDMFSQSFAMSLDDGDDRMRTKTGALCSVIVMSIVCLYSYLKVDVLI